jgi:IclR family mhp operon transcriptional activator
MAARQENVRALVRGLDVLRYLNSVGAARASEISAALEIPRPTVYRLLRTLEEEGYVLFSSTDSRARVSALAAALGDNSAARSRLCHAAGPFLSKFTDQHSWPVDLSVYENAHMVIQETTHGRSPLSVDNNMVGFALPMLRSSAGRAYLAACEARECEIILDLLRNENLLEDQPFLQGRWLDEHLVEYAKQGYATRGPRTFRPKTSSLAVPILQNDRVVGCLSIIWITKAVTMADATARYMNSLKNLATEIGEELARPLV